MMFPKGAKAAAENDDATGQETLRRRLENCDLDLRTDMQIAGIFRRFGDIRRGSIPERYREFLFAARDNGLAQVEQLLPYLDVPANGTLAEAQCTAQDDVDGALDLLNAYPPEKWFYYMPLSKDFATLGRKSELTGAAETSRRRHEFRLSYIFRGLEAVLGQAPGAGLGGRNVLDMACNWGGFSIEAKLRGAGGVNAFDIRPENVAKARRLLQHFRLDDVTIDQGDIFTYDAGKTHDVVLNLGLMYHVSQPFEMMQKTYEMTGEVAIIETVAHKECFSGFIIGSGELGVGHATTAIGVELHPTYRGLLDLARLVGFRHVIELRGMPEPGWNDFRADDYGNGNVRCIACLK